MQNRYFGDVGDFGKYGLLRALSGDSGQPRLKLGVVWYLYPNESHNEDGKHVGYLRAITPAFRNCDEPLYDKLRSLLFDGSTLISTNRHLRSAEMSLILPKETIFYSKALCYTPSLSAAARLATRNEWITGALSATESADLIFLDPDNGIECSSVSRTSSKGPKYAYWDDVDAFIDRGQSVVVYHHLNRSTPHHDQIDEKIARICQRYSSEIGTCAVTFNRGTSRAYFLVASPNHKAVLFQRMMRFAHGLWGRHFTSHHHSISLRGPTALDLKGIFADSSQPYDPDEREKALVAIYRDEARKGSI